MVLVHFATDSKPANRVYLKRYYKSDGLNFVPVIVAIGTRRHRWPRIGNHIDKKTTKATFSAGSVSFIISDPKSAPLVI